MLFLTIQTHGSLCRSLCPALTARARLWHGPAVIQLSQCTRVCFCTCSASRCPVVSVCLCLGAPPGSSPLPGQISSSPTVSPSPTAHRLASPAPAPAPPASYMWSSASRCSTHTSTWIISTLSDHHTFVAYKYTHNNVTQTTIIPFSPGLSSYS